MADRKLVQRIQVQHATAEHGVAGALHGITFDQLKNVIRSASVPISPQSIGMVFAK